MGIPITEPCGTRAAAARHRRRKEELCDECRTAERTYYRERARLAYSIPAYRAKENARSAARSREMRRSDPTYRARVNAQRAERRRREQNLSRLIVDAVVVERLIHGVAVVASRVEKRAAFDEMRGRGFTISDCCTQLRLSGSTGNAWDIHRLKQGTSTGFASQCTGDGATCADIATTEQTEVA
jgi:hypothetical protein